MPLRPVLSAALVVVAVVAVAVVAVACGDSSTTTIAPAPPATSSTTTAAPSTTSPAADSVVVTWQTPDGGTFRSVVSGADAVARVEEALAGDGYAGIPNGRLEPGDGGINTGHDWQQVDVELVDMAIEVCDGNASDIDDDLDYWLDTVGQYCPWDARVIAVEPAS
jgi:hypothetical protein